MANKDTGNQVSIGFWKSRKDTLYFSHSRGLTEEQVSFLRSFEPGDIFVLFVNEPNSAKKNRADLSLAKSHRRANEESNEEKSYVLPGEDLKVPLEKGADPF